MELSEEPHFQTIIEFSIVQFGQVVLLAKSCCDSWWQCLRQQGGRQLPEFLEFSRNFDEFLDFLGIVLRVATAQASS